MARSAAKTRVCILDAAYVLFRKKGFTRVNVDEIADASGITKRTLYAHFTSKDELLAAVLEAQHRLAADAFQTFGHRLSGTAGEMVEEIFEELSRWAERPRWAGSGFTRLVVELADLPGHPARSIARRHKAELEIHLAQLLGSAGIAPAKQRARELWILFEGAMILALIHGDRAYIGAAARAAKALMERSAKRAVARR